MKTSTSLSESLWCGSLSADRLELCVAYTGARPNTGMVLVEVELLAGWRAVSPERLTNQVEALVQRVLEMRVRVSENSEMSYVFS